MAAIAPAIENLTLSITQEIHVRSSLAAAFAALLEQMGPANEGHDGRPMPMTIEPWPGGRWFRDLGDQNGHLWGHVQVIKPPVLIELSGPMFMSYPAINHLELKLDEIAGGTKVILRHRAIGFLDPQHKEGVTQGWHALLDSIAGDFTKMSGTPA